MDTIQTNPSEGVSNQTSGTSRNKNEDLIKELHNMDVDWKLDLDELVSFVMEQKKNGKTIDEMGDELSDYISDQYYNVRESLDTFDLIEDLEHEIEELIEIRIKDDLEHEKLLLLGYLDGGLWMDDHTTKPSEDVSTETSGTSRNNNEHLIKVLQGMDVNWLLDLEDFISLVEELKELDVDDPKRWFWIRDHICDRSHEISSKWSIEMIDEYHLWDEVRVQIRQVMIDEHDHSLSSPNVLGNYIHNLVVRRVYLELKTQSDLILEYLDYEIIMK